MKALKSIILLLLFTLLSFFVIGFNNKTIAVSNDRYVGEVQLGGDTIGIKIKTKDE